MIPASFSIRILALTVALYVTFTPQASAWIGAVAAAVSSPCLTPPSLPGWCMWWPSALPASPSLSPLTGHARYSSGNTCTSHTSFIVRSFTCSCPLTFSWAHKRNLAIVNSVHTQWYFINSLCLYQWNSSQAPNDYEAPA